MKGSNENTEGRSEEKRSSLTLLRLHCSSPVSSVEPRWPLTCWVKIKNFPKGKARAGSTWDGLLLKKFYCRTWGNFSWDGERPGKPVWRRREASQCHANPAGMQRVGGIQLQAALTPDQQPENTKYWEHSYLFGVSGQFSCLHEGQESGIQTGSVSEIPASCKVHLVVALVLIRLTHLCQDSVQMDGNANTPTSCQQYATVQLKVAQHWAECDRTSTSFLATVQRCHDLNTASNNSQLQAMLPKPVPTLEGWKSNHANHKLGVMLMCISAGDGTTHVANNFICNPVAAKWNIALKGCSLITNQ